MSIYYSILYFLYMAFWDGVQKSYLQLLNSIVL